MSEAAPSATRVSVPSAREKAQNLRKCRLARELGAFGMGIAHDGPCAA
jgi:hypothetical protein